MQTSLAILRKAGAITEAAYAATLPRLRHGMTTLDLITEVNYQLKKHGSLRATRSSTSFYNMGRNFPFNFHNKDEVLLHAARSARVDLVRLRRGATTATATTSAARVFFGEPDAEYRRSTIW